MILKYRFWTRSIGEETLYRIARMKKFNWLIYQCMCPYIGRRILEAGCGAGTFTGYFPNAEYFLGVDQDEKFITKLRDAYAEFPQFEFLHSKLENINVDSLKSKNIDTIICINVLEHIEDDFEVLKKFYSLLREGGVLILLVPALPSLYSALDEALGHIRRYEFSSLRERVEDAGFRIVREDYFNFFGVLGWWINGKLYEHFTPIFFNIERKLKIPFGLSIFLVAKK